MLIYVANNSGHFRSVGFIDFLIHMVPTLAVEAVKQQHSDIEEEEDLL